MRYVYYLTGAVLVEIVSTAIAKALILQENILAYLVSPVFLLLSYYFLGKAVQGIALSMAYAVWGGLGLLGTAVVGYAVFGEPLTLPKIVAFCLLFMGLVLLHKGTSLPGGDVHE